MLLQTKNKAGISVIITYVLLIGIAVILGGIMYTWMKSFIPADEGLECPDGTNLAIESYEYNCSNLNNISLNLINNGRFDIAGYFIKASNISGYKIATIDFSQHFIKTNNDVSNFSGSIVFSGGNVNTFKPDEETTNSFNLAGLGQIYFIEIVPSRWQSVNSKLRYLSCGDSSKYQELISCQ